MRSMTSFVRDNIEAFAVAIAMALVIRHYSVEAFRIPTGSMMPSLYGDSKPGEPRRHGDRILVDKFAWMRDDPRRFQVAVFQYPLNRNVNFIKRIAGLPGEWLAIADGDVWASVDNESWTIQRKPAALREELLIPYWPTPPGNSSGFSGDCWNTDKDWTVEGDRLAVDASQSGASVEFARNVLTYPHVDHSGGSMRSAVRVGDIRFAADVSVEREGELEFHIKENGVTHRLVLGIDESFLEVGGAKAQRMPVDFRVERDESFFVSFANVDAALVGSIDDDEFVFEFPNLPDVPPGLGPDYGVSDEVQGDNGFSILSRGCKATFESARIDRDLHYLRSEGDDHPAKWHIPDGHYFMLGDNTNYSKDSRAWNVGQLTLHDGTTIEWEHEKSINPQPSDISDLDPDEMFVIPLDSEGLVRRIRRDTIASWKYQLEWPFVPRDHLIGRAFGVFWPIYVPPIYRGPTRIQRIR
ncbi:MAG: signal peptidase I [Planctomycetota bacterium]